jgi:hypothetical protein
MPNKYTPPEATVADAGTAAVRAVVQVIPGGGSALELLNLAIAPPLERRRDEWARLIAEGLAAVEVKLEDLGTRDEPLDTFLQASAAAMRTSSKEKLEALRNAVVNSAVKAEPDQDERAILLQLVDRFTPTHLLILQAVDDPVRWARDHNVNYRPAMTSSLSAFLEAAFPELHHRVYLYDAIWSELHRAGFVNTESLHGSMSANGWADSRTTDYGKRFLGFIAQPVVTSAPPSAR